MTYCGADCKKCGFNAKCGGCENTCGNPFGGNCLAAEYIKFGGTDSFNAFKKELLSEINGLGIDGMSPVTELYCLPGFYVNLGYPLPGGETVKFLSDKRVYLGAQVPSLFEDGENSRCFGIVADRGFILVSEYGENGSSPELVMLKRR